MYGRRFFVLFFFFFFFWNKRGIMVINDGAASGPVNFSTRYEAKSSPIDISRRIQLSDSI